METSDFGARLDQLSDFLAHLVTMWGLSIFLVRTYDLPPVTGVLLTGSLLGANLLLLQGFLLKAVHMGSAAVINQGMSPRWLSLLSQGKHIVDTGLFLFVSALLTLIPAALFVYLVIYSFLSFLWVLTSVASNWMRQSKIRRNNSRV